MSIDAHTHSLQAIDAIIAVEPNAFTPQPLRLYSVGIHPWHTDTTTEHDLELLRQVAQHPQVVAIGETGLDHLRGAPQQRQTEIFEKHLLVAGQLNKPVIIHSVRSSQQVLQCCRRLAINVPCAIHGMRSNEFVAQSLVNAGFYLSFGIRFSANTVRATPLDRLLIETDDSDVSISQVAAAIAPVRQLSVPDLLSLAEANLHRFLYQ